MEETRQTLTVESKVLDEAQQQLEEVSHQLSVTRTAFDIEHPKLVETTELLKAAEERQQHLLQEIIAANANLEDRQSETENLSLREAEIRESLVQLESREKELQASVVTLTASEQTVRLQYEEMSQQKQEIEITLSQREKELSEKLGATAQELAELEGQLLPLRDWKTKMDALQEHLSSLDSDSLESRNVRNEIEMAMATLRYLLSNAGASRARAQLAMSRPQAQPTQIVDQSGTEATPTMTGLQPPDSVSMNSRLSRLRESIQREEARLQFLNQERERQEQRNRLQRNADPALKEQNRKLEEQIRLNETRLSMLEARLQNGQKDESRQRETMMTLTQQINELRVTLSTVATCGQEQS